MVMLTLSVRKEEKEIIAMQNVGIEYTPRFEDEKKSNDSDEDNNNQFGQSGPEPDKTHNNCASHSTNRQYSREERFKLERTKEMFHQALLYVGVFYLTWTLPTIGSGLKMHTNRNYVFVFPLTVLTVLLLPLQGFWNWLIYRRGPCVA